MQRLLLASALSAVLLITSTPGVVGSDPLILIPHFAAWCYNDAGTTPPPTWTERIFDDAQWKRGETWILNQLEPTIEGGPITVYFRGHFTYPSNGADGVVLLASNHLNVGAVYYLNGTEVGRAWMPTGTVDYGTFALSTRYPTTEPLKFVVTNVVEGDNVYAAEIHRVSSNYPSLTFSSSLTAVFPEPIEIVSPRCQDQTIEENQLLRLSVQVTGSDPVFQWYKDGARIAMATKAAYELGVTPAVAGNFWVVITNAISAVTGCVTHVTVTPDVTAPGLVSAMAQETTSPPYYILVRFTERIRPDGATIRGNYSISSLDSPGESLVISNAQVNANLVRLTTSPWRTDGNYVLTVRNVADLRSNFFSPLSNRVAVIIPPGRLMFPFAGISKGWNGCEARARGLALPPDWKGPEFDDGDPDLWPEGRGVIYCGNPWWPSYLQCATLGDEMCEVFQCPTPVPNPLLDTDEYVDFFRSHFVSETSAVPTCLWLEYSVYDQDHCGFVFHLNGIEIHRFQVPIPHIISEFPVCVWSSGWVPVTNLLQGDNVLAVEVHRLPFGAFGGTVYGVEVRAVVPAPLPPLPVISITNSDCPCVFNVSWPAAGFPSAVLQTTTNLVSGPWTTVATNSPYAAEKTPGGSQFFRLSGPDDSW